MKYALLLYGDEAAWDAMSEAEQGAVIGEYFAYTQALENAGVMVAGEPLDAAATGKAFKAGQAQVQDGPFADAKEQLGGFYVIDVADLDAALDWAARCPGAAHGAVEVRPVLPTGAAASDGAAAEAATTP